MGWRHPAQRTNDALARSDLQRCMLELLRTSYTTCLQHLFFMPDVLPICRGSCDGLSQTDGACGSSALCALPSGRLEWQVLTHVGLQPGFRAPGIISRLTRLHIVMYVAKAHKRNAMAAHVIWSHTILSRLFFHIRGLSVEGYVPFLPFL